MAPTLANAFGWAMVPAAAFGVLAVVQLLGPSSWNRQVSVWLQGPEVMWLTLLGAATDALFLAETVLPLAALAFLVLAWRRHWLLALSVGCIVPVVGLEVVLKYLLDVPNASTYLQVRKVLQTPGAPTALEHGFPSGHASRAGFTLGWLAIALTPPRYRKPVFAGVAVLTLAVCWTRIYVGDHSLLEILAGLALALTFLIPAAALAQLDREQATAS
jgi:membrane-associated phospholipid phosphatase